MECYIGMIANFGFNFAPNGWAICQGQVMNINQNTALYSVLGTSFGGNGNTTFGLPNLSGRVMVGQGSLPGGGTYAMGQAAGSENTTLSAVNMPTHTHTAALSVSSSAGTTNNPSGALLASANYTDDTGQAVPVQVYSPSGSSGTLAPTQTSPAGGNQAFSLLSPYLTVNSCIALQGIYPTRA